MKITNERTSRETVTSFHIAEVGEDLHASYSSKVFAPGFVKIIVRDGKLANVMVSGPVRKKDGTLSETQTGKTEYHAFGNGLWHKLPEWLQGVVVNYAEDWKRD